MLIRSLRWRLQAWHAAVLVLVLILFGGIVYGLQWQTRLQQTDAELDRTAEALTSQLRRLLPPPPLVPFRHPGHSGAAYRAAGGHDLTDTPVPGPIPAAASPVQSGADQPDPHAGPMSVTARSDRPPAPPLAERAATAEWSHTSNPEALRHNHSGGHRPKSGHRHRPPRGDSGESLALRGEFARSHDAATAGHRLPDELVQLFEGGDGAGLYFAVWSPAGELIQKSKAAPEIPFPGLRLGTDDLPSRSVRTRGQYREVVHATRPDINVLVGRSMARDLAAQQRSALILALSGLAVLTVGLAGGWWFTSQAIRPLAGMSATAASISAQSLSTRINVHETDDELGQLAQVLNATFDRLEAAFDQQSRFTADASHELRTPLAVILSHTELALARRRSDEEYRAALEACRRASQRMKTLIESLLLLARFDAGEAALRLATVDLQQVVAETMELVRPLAEARQIAVAAQSLPVSVVGDQERLAQVLTNLLTNAIRYNRDGGQVEIRIRVENGEAVLTVIDTGIGIPDVDLPHVCERFYRVGAARSRADGGNGLGLSICHSIVEAHGGTIAISSHEQFGTEVEVRLPASVPVRPPAPGRLDAAAEYNPVATPV